MDSSFADNDLSCASSLRQTCDLQTLHCCWGRSAAHSSVRCIQEGLQDSLIYKALQNSTKFTTIKAFVYVWLIFAEQHKGFPGISAFTAQHPTHSGPSDCIFGPVWLYRNKSYCSTVLEVGLLLQQDTY